jgi:hypothetical protein
VVGVSELAGARRVIFLWAHSRSASTGFLRMMIERGDVTVLHEPFLALHQDGRVAMPAPDGGPPELASSGPELAAALSRLGEHRPVFVKEVLDYRYPEVFDHLAGLASMTHTFLVRDPRQAISSHYAVKPTVTCPEIGYERLHELFELLWAAGGAPPLVIRAEKLLADPAATVRDYCQAVGLPFLPAALSWAPGDRLEWQRHRGWHLDAIASSGLAAREHDYPVTVDNSPALRAFYDHHYPYYRRIVQHAR